jgi:hypothetical protein
MSTPFCHQISARRQALVGDLPTHQSNEIAFRILQEGQPFISGAIKEAVLIGEDDVRFGVNLDSLGSQLFDALANIAHAQVHERRLDSICVQQESGLTEVEKGKTRTLENSYWFLIEQLGIESYRPRQIESALSDLAELH